MISLNKDGSFSITELAKEILWSKSIPTWAKILRLLQIKSCNIGKIESILKISRNEIIEEVEKLRKNQLVLMSPQRIEDKVIKVYEILPEGILKIDETETKGFVNTEFGEVKQDVEILNGIELIIKEIQGTQLEQSKKDSIIEKLSAIKEKLKI